MRDNKKRAKERVERKSECVSERVKKEGEKERGEIERRGKRDRRKHRERGGEWSGLVGEKSTTFNYPFTQP